MTRCYDSRHARCTSFDLSIAHSHDDFAVGGGDGAVERVFLLERIQREFRPASTRTLGSALRGRMPCAAGIPRIQNQYGAQSSNKATGGLSCSRLQVQKHRRRLAPDCGSLANGWFQFSSANNSSLMLQHRGSVRGCSVAVIRISHHHRADHHFVPRLIAPVDFLFGVRIRPNYLLSYRSRHRTS